MSERKIPYKIYLEENEMRLVMAHELGHAIMHRKVNCYFIRNQTLLLNSKREIEANTFAMNLLLTDDMLYEYKDYTINQLICNDLLSSTN